LRDFFSNKLKSILKVTRR